MEKSLLHAQLCWLCCRTDTQTVTVQVHRAQNDRLWCFYEGTFLPTHCNCILSSNHHNFGHFPVFGRKYSTQCMQAYIEVVAINKVEFVRWRTDSPVDDKSATLWQVLAVIARHPDPRSFLPKFMSHFFFWISREPRSLKFLWTVIILYMAF